MATTSINNPNSRSSDAPKAANICLPLTSAHHPTAPRPVVATNTIRASVRRRLIEIVMPQRHRSRPLGPLIVHVWQLSVATRKKPSSWRVPPRQSTVAPSRPTSSRGVAASGAQRRSIRPLSHLGTRRRYPGGSHPAPLRSAPAGPAVLTEDRAAECPDDRGDNEAGL